MPKTSSTHQPIFLAQGNPENSVELLSGVSQLLALPGSAPTLDLIQLLLCLPGLCSWRYMAVKQGIVKIVEITSHAGKFLYQRRLFLPRGSFILNPSEPLHHYFLLAQGDSGSWKQGSLELFVCQLLGTSCLPNAGHFLFAISSGLLLPYLSSRYNTGNLPCHEISRF